VRTEFTLQPLRSEEVTVTAMLREQELGDVPFSVAAPTEEVLRKRGAVDIEGVAARLRELVPTDNAILGIDLADEKQAIVLTDHDSQVLARTRVKAKAWRLGPVLRWGREQARKHGFADVTVGCEPTGHRWRVLDQLAAQQNMVLVCVQPLLTGRARESEDYTPR